MTEPPDDATRRAGAARETIRREAIRLARDNGAPIVTRPILPASPGPAVRDVEPLAGATAARDLEHAARRATRDYIRQAREAGHDWDQIGRALHLEGPDREGASPADAAYTCAAGEPDTQAPWRPRTFTWTCRSCGQHITDHGVIQHPADDEIGHADNCARLAADIAAHDAQAAAWDAEWEAGR